MRLKHRATEPLIISVKLMLPKSQEYTIGASNHFANAGSAMGATPSRLQYRLGNNVAHLRGADLAKTGCAGTEDITSTVASGNHLAHRGFDRLGHLLQPKAISQHQGYSEDER